MNDWTMTALARVGVTDVRVALAVRALLVGTAVGVVAGTGTFMFGNPDVSPFPARPWIALVPVVLAGVFTRLLARTLRESFGAAVVGFVVGGVVTVLLWLSPVLVLPYSGVAAELMAAPRLRDAIADVMTILLLFYGGSYLAAVTAGGFLE